jgi:hypothetical protein
MLAASVAPNLDVLELLEDSMAHQQLQEVHDVIVCLFDCIFLFA